MAIGIAGIGLDGRRPLLALGVAIIAISTSAILVRWSDAPSLIKAFYRLVFTLILLAPVAVTRHRSAFRDLSRRDLLAAGLAGLALAVHFGSWFKSIEWTSVAASVTLVQSQPVFVAIGGYLLLGERLGRRTATAIAVAITGMAVMSLGGGGAAVTGARPIYGNSLALLGAVMMAGYVLVGRSLRQRHELLPYVTVVYSVCTVALLGFALADGSSVILTDYPPREWVLFLAMAIGPGILGHTVINWALRHVESSVVSVSLLGEPLGSTVLAAVLLAEIPGRPTVVGGGIVLAGIYLTVRARDWTTAVSGT